MKAIVMAGGEGTRLRPLTEGRPKPMVELLGRPVLERTVEHLKNNGITDICFTLRYLPKVIEEYFGDGERFGVSITHRVETEPLGTAGGVRACRDFIGDEEVLVISGDAVCSFDLRLALEFFERKSADASIVLYEHPEPTRFGLVITDGDGRVTSFAEKPSWDRVVTSMVNTGIYILSPKAVDMIPEGQPYDFGKDLFPRLLREGARLYASPAEGYWCDIGSPEAYRECCIDAVRGVIGLDLKAPETEPGVWSNVPLEGVTLVPPVYVGEGCGIAPGARLGPNAVVSRGSSVGKGATVRDSVINGAAVGKGCLIEGAIIGRGAILSANARAGRGCVVGDGASIGEGCVLAPGVRVWTDRRVPGGKRLSKSLTGDAPAEPVKFSSDSRVAGDIAVSLTPETALAMGAVLGKDGRVGVAHTGGEAARLIADAILCGVTAAGGGGCRLDAGFEAQLAGVAELFALSSAAFARQDGELVTVTFLTGRGTGIGTEKRRKLESAAAGERPKTAAAIGAVSAVSGTARAYISGVIEEIRALAGHTRGMTLAVTGSGAENRALRCVLAGLGFTVGKAKPGTASFSVSPGGFELTCRDERGRETDACHTLTAAARCLMCLGVKKAAIPDDAPTAVERLATRYGSRVYRASSPEGGELWEGQRFLRDAVIEAAVIAASMAKDGAELSRILDDLPPFETGERRAEIGVSGARAMRLLAAQSAELALEPGGGLRLSGARGTVRVAPSFDGAALRFMAEAQTSEMADELCCKAESLIRKITNNR